MFEHGDVEYLSLALYFTCPEDQYLGSLIDVLGMRTEDGIFALAGFLSHCIYLCTRTADLGHSSDVSTISDLLSFSMS